MEWEGGIIKTVFQEPCDSCLRWLPVSHISPKNALPSFPSVFDKPPARASFHHSAPLSPVAQLQKPEHGLLLGSQRQETEGARLVGGGWARGGACGQPEPGSGSGPAAPPCLEDAAAVLRKATSFPAESGRFRNCLACFLTFCNCSCCVPTLSLSQHRKTASLRHQGAAVSVYFVKGRALCSCSQLLSELA